MDFKRGFCTFHVDYFFSYSTKEENSWKNLLNLHENIGFDKKKEIRKKTPGNNFKFPWTICSPLPSKDIKWNGLINGNEFYLYRVKIKIYIFMGMA